MLLEHVGLQPGRGPVPLGAAGARPGRVGRVRRLRPSRGRRVLHIDGVSFTPADTEENRARHDVPSGQAPGCGFPAMSALAVRSDETGAFLSAFPGKWKVHDFRLFIEALPFFRKGDIVVGDRALCAFASMGLLPAPGADMVARHHQRRKFDRSEAKRNADGSWTVVWRKGRHSPKSPAGKELWEGLPDEVTVRIIEGVVERKGFSSGARASSSSPRFSTASPFPPSGSASSTAGAGRSRSRSATSRTRWATASSAPGSRTPS